MSSKQHPTSLPDLPVEISLLLFQAMKADGFIDSHHLHRRYLSSCSCVCKFWAREIREAIFRRIAIRSHKDFQRLAHILSTSPSSIASYVKELEIYESRDSTTSAQAIAYLLREHLHSIRSIERRLLDASNDKSCRQAFSSGGGRAYIGLRFCSSTLTRLTLANYHFRNLGAIARLLGPLSNLEELCCIKVSWGAGGKTPSGHIWQHPLKLRSISTSQHEQVQDLERLTTKHSSGILVPLARVQIESSRDAIIIGRCVSGKDSFFTVSLSPRYENSLSPDAHGVTWCLEATSYPSMDRRCISRGSTGSRSQTLALAEISTFCPGATFFGITENHVNKYLDLAQYQMAQRRAQEEDDTFAASLYSISWSHAETMYDITFDAPRIIPLGPKEMLFIFNLKDILRRDQRDKILLAQTTIVFVVNVSEWDGENLAVDFNHASYMPFFSSAFDTKAFGSVVAPFLEWMRTTYLSTLTKYGYNIIFAETFRSEIISPIWKDRSQNISMAGADQAFALSGHVLHEISEATTASIHISDHHMEQKTLLTIENIPDQQAITFSMSFLSGEESTAESTPTSHEISDASLIVLYRSAEGTTENVHFKWSPGWLPSEEIDGVGTVWISRRMFATRILRILEDFNAETTLVRDPSNADSFITLKQRGITLEKTQWHQDANLTSPECLAFSWYYNYDATRREVGTYVNHSWDSIFLRTENYVWIPTEVSPKSNDIVLALTGEHAVRVSRKGFSDQTTTVRWKLAITLVTASSGFKVDVQMNHRTSTEPEGSTLLTDPYDPLDKIEGRLDVLAKILQTEIAEEFSKTSPYNWFSLDERSYRFSSPIFTRDGDLVYEVYKASSATTTEKITVQRTTIQQESTRIGGRNAQRQAIGSATQTDTSASQSQPRSVSLDNPSRRLTRRGQ